MRSLPSVFVRIFRGYLVVVFAMALLLSLVILGEFNTSARRTSLSDLTRVGRALEPSVAPLVADSVFSRLRSHVRSAGTAMGARILVVNRSGSVIADSDPSLPVPENVRTRPDVIAAFNGREGTFENPGGPGDPYTLNASVPILFVDSVIAVMRVSLETDRWHGAMNNLARKILIMILGLLMLALAAGWFIARGIASPLRELAELTERVKEGDLGARASPGTTREHMQLATVLNDTLSRTGKLVEELRDSDRRNLAVLRSIVEGLAVTDGRGGIVLTNDAFSALFHAQPDGRGIPPAVTEVLCSKEEKGRLDTSGRSIAFESAPIEGTAGRVFSFRDITGEERMENMKREFTINVAHELRTPLTAIKGYTETLLENPSDDSAPLLRVIARNADRMISLVRDIQTLSELEDSAATEPPSRVLVRETLETVLPLFRSSAEGKGLELEVFQDDQELAVSVDRYRLEQVLVNLLENALRYTDSGRIQVRAERYADLVAIAVSDTGPGIAPEHLPRLFERFYVVDRSRSRRVGGTGLGLAIVKHIVEGMGGSVRVDSTPGAGTIFTVMVPVAR
ncbi:MAG: ATP-binding protein [Candidatus Fermentibacteraceae bacterium]